MHFFVIIFAVSIASCNSHQINTSSQNINKIDTFIRHDTVYLSGDNNSDWQINFNLTHNPEQDTISGKPVSYYLHDSQCATIAYEFYYGYFKPSDNGATEELLKYAVTDNNKLRPFYRWCLDKTIEISDGALSELIGVPARRYAEKFPNEFFQFMDRDTTKERYKNWISVISYSGFYDNEDYKNPEEIVNKVINTMNRNCEGCNQRLKQRIDTFANSCFR